MKFISYKLLDTTQLFEGAAFIPKLDTGNRKITLIPSFMPASIFIRKSDFFTLDVFNIHYYKFPQWFRLRLKLCDKILDFLQKWTNENQVIFQQTCHNTESKMTVKGTMKIKTFLFCKQLFSYDVQLFTTCKSLPLMNKC